MKKVIIKYLSFSFNSKSIMTEQAINLTQLLDTFQLFDTNKDGSISSNEVCKFEKIIFHILFFNSASISMSKTTDANR
jgi:Ca2+-binding EF-hand superfamily protein